MTFECCRAETGAGTQNMYCKITGFNMIAGEIAYWEIHQVMWDTIKRRVTYAVADSKQKQWRFFRYCMPLQYFVELE
jgi:hypothetical protein